jgi:rubrerythrin
MKLTQFGTALKFAMDLEARAMEIYEEAGCRAADAQTMELFASLVSSAKRRKGLLERLYRENTYSDMDTGIFEPLAGLNDTDYVIARKSAGEDGASDILKSAIELQDTIERFYLDLAEQLKSRRSGLSRELVKAVRESSEDKLRLKSLQQKAPSG